MPCPYACCNMLHDDCSAYCVSLACTLNSASSSEPAAVVAVATLLCSLVVSAAVAAFLKASCNQACLLSIQAHVTLVTYFAHLQYYETAAADKLAGYKQIVKPLPQQNSRHKPVIQLCKLLHAGQACVIESRLQTLITAPESSCDCDCCCCCCCSCCGCWWGCCCCCCGGCHDCGGGES